MFSRVSEHEQSQVHKDSVAGYYSWGSDRDIRKQIDRQTMMRSDYVREKRNILHRIIDVIKLIGKLGFAYRKKK